MIVLAGNHDIGYGATMKPFHVKRFEAAFGPLNSVYEITGHRVVKVNSMNLDTSGDKEMSAQTWGFVKEMARLQKEEPLPLILLTHIPLHKPAGNCVDAPFTDLNRSGPFEFLLLV